MLTPTFDFDKTDAEGRRSRCGDDATQSGLGVAAPQAMKTPIAAGHHGVAILFEKVDTEVDAVWSELSEAPHQSLRTDLVHTTYVFLMYQGYDILYFGEAHCTSMVIRS